MRMRLLALRTIVIALAVMLVVGAAYAQRGRWSYREGTMAPIFAPAMMPDANFIPCRLMYRSVRAEAMGIGWETDYPYAEINLTIRLSELTKTPVSLDERRVPHHYVVRMTDDALFNCPFTIASDVGTIGLSPVEAERLGVPEHETGSGHRVLVRSLFTHVTVLPTGTREIVGV